jgi:hypothetical protein
MNNLSPRDTLLVIILINVVCYWIGWQFICSPLIKSYKATREEYGIQVEERNRLQTEVDNYPQYKQTVEDREKEKNDVLERRFYPTVYSEVFHKWVFDQGENSIANKITTFTIEPKVATTTNADGQMEELDFVDNNVQISFVSTYDECMEFLKKIETKDVKGDSKGKSAALTQVAISPTATETTAVAAGTPVLGPDGQPIAVVSATPSAANLDVTLTYSFYSISKDDNRMEKEFKDNLHMGKTKAFKSIGDNEKVNFGMQS